MSKKELMHANEILDYIDKLYEYKGIDSKDHIINPSTWRSWKNSYNKNHIKRPITNQGNQKTKGALYSKTDIGNLIRWKKLSLDKLFINKTKSPLDHGDFIDLDFKNRVPISQLNSINNSNDNLNQNYMESNIKEQILSYFDLGQISKDINSISTPSKEMNINIRKRLNNPIMYLNNGMVNKYQKLNDLK